MAKLTPNQKRFVDEYMVDRNATRAYMAAYKSAKSYEGAAVSANRLLKNANVAAAVAERLEQLTHKLEITQERVLAELAAIGFANATDFVTVTQAGLLHIKATSEVPAEKLPALASIKYGANMGIELKLHDKVKALELLGKHLGIFSSGNNGAPAAEENNIFEVINQSTREDINTDEIPEIEPPAKPGDDVVE